MNLTFFKSRAIQPGLLLALALCSLPTFAQDAPPKEATEKPFLFEVVRHVYRWHLDEEEIEKVRGLKTFTFEVRALHPKLDEEDKSRFLEVYLPVFGVSVRMKQADYKIPELKTEVKSAGYKITNVARTAPPKQRLPGTSAIEVSFPEMKEYLFKTRQQAEFPDAELVERCREALRKELAAEAKSDPTLKPEGTQFVHFAPLSPVANEMWVYWENGRRLIRFSSDIDLANPDVWKHETLAVRVFDVYNQVVITLDDAAGSNGYMTRNHVGRALYNCVVLGKREELTPPAAAK